MKSKRVVITGMGAVSPLGHSVKETWANILEGKNGISLIEHFDTTDFATKFAGLVKDFDPKALGLNPKDCKKMDTFIQYGMVAAKEALLDSGLEVTDANAHRIGTCLGSGIGGLPLVEKNRKVLDKSGPRKISPFFIPGTIINMFPGFVSIEHNLRGPSFSVVSACASGTHAIGVAARHIAYGDADVILAGGAEKASSELGIAGFNAARALSTRNDDYETASRPWDKDRDGFVLGDGAGVLVLESLEHAQARGAKIYAELAGFGMSADAYHMTQLSGEGAVRCMKSTLEDAGLNPEDVHYINAHATSTPIGDKGEVASLKEAFGESIYKIPVSSTKSMIGHLLGAAGAVEAVVSIMAMQDNVAPPTTNLQNPSEECDLDFVPGQAREMKIDVALSNSFGFGGTNASLIFKKL